MLSQFISKYIFLKDNKECVFFLLNYTLINLAFSFFRFIFPLLVVEKFGLGIVFTFSLMVKVLPKVLVAPLWSKILLKIGAKNILIGILIVLNCIYFIFPIIENSILFQSVIFLISIIEMGLVHSLLILRSQVIPNGKNVEINTLVSNIEEISSIIAPIFLGFLFLFLPLNICYYCTTVFMFAMSGFLLIIKRKKYFLQSLPSTTAKKRINTGYSAFFNLFIHKKKVWHIFLPMLSFGIFAGSLTPFLMYTTTETFGLPKEKWTFLLTVYGIGTFLSSIFAPKLINWINKKKTMLFTYVITRIVPLILASFLVISKNYFFFLCMLFLTSLLTIVGHVCLYSLIQKNLNQQEEGIFHTYSMQVYYIIMVIGTSLSNLYVLHWVSLQNFWLITLLISSIPLLSCLKRLLFSKHCWYHQ